jgi:hypothetical protein
VADAPVPPPPPVAIRITRPYATEDEYLERELETLTRASVTLLGAQSRPQGVVLRFELVLMSGQVLMRGEGRVVGFKANAFEGLGGLTLRFTRLDTKSKSLVDKAAALRERRRPSTRPQVLEAVDGSPFAPPMSAMPVPPQSQRPAPTFVDRPDTPSPFAPAPSAAELPVASPSPSSDASPSTDAAASPSTDAAASPSADGAASPSVDAAASPSTDAAASPSTDAAASPSADGAVSAPSLDAAAKAVPTTTVDRDSLLERLRSRAKALDTTDVQRILTARRHGG